MVQATATEAFKAGMQQAVEDNALHLWSELEIEMHYTVLSTQYISGIPHPLVNGVLRTHFALKNASKLIEQTIHHFKWRKLPFTWWVDHRTTPPDLGGRLEQQGLTSLGIFQGMALNLAREVQPIESDDIISILPVNDLADMNEWGSVIGTNFIIHPQMATSYAQLYIKKGLIPPSPFRHFIAKIEEKPVAASTLFMHQGVAGIYNVSVLPDARRHGIAKAIVHHLMQYARQFHCKIAIVQCSPIGVPLYRSLGFTKILDFHFYIWPGSDSTMIKSWAANPSKMPY